MLKKTETPLLDILKTIPDSFKVLDVGAAYAPTKRADVVIDIVPYDNVHWNQAKGNSKERFSKDTYVQHDICSRELWPFYDKQFDYSICSHVLEDIRDPLWVCSEIIRVSKSGYIEIPSRIYEQTFGIETKKLTGAAHHRWIIDLVDGKIRFTFKYFYVYYRVLNKMRKASKKDDLVLRIEWRDSFDYFENWLNSGKEIFEYFLERPITQKEMWRIYRKTQRGNVIVRWLKYFKNTNAFLNALFKKLKKHENNYPSSDKK